MTGRGRTISVVIPALDEETSIAAAVNSAREAGADEVVVVDGGSRDGTVPAARSLADAVISSPAGRGRQMNVGAGASSGEILLFLHADTRLPRGGADAVRAACGPAGARGGAFSVELDVSPGASPYARAVLRATAVMINARARVTGAYTGDQAIFVRRDVFEEVGGYPEIPLMEDVELSRRLTDGGKCVLLPARVATSARRWESRGPARTILLMWGLRLAHRMGLPPDRCARLYRATPR